MQAFGLQPRPHRIKIVIGKPEARPHFFRRQPVMKLRRRGISLIREKLLQCRFLLRRPFEHQGHLFQLQIRRCRARVVGRIRPLRAVIDERLHPPAVHRLKNAVGALRPANLHGYGCQHPQQGSAQPNQPPQPPESNLGETQPDR